MNPNLAQDAAEALSATLNSLAAISRGDLGGETLQRTAQVLKRFHALLDE